MGMFTELQRRAMWFLREPHTSRELGEHLWPGKRCPASRGLKIIEAIGRPTIKVVGFWPTRYKWIGV